MNNRPSYKREILYLSGPDVRRLFSIDNALKAARRAFCEASMRNIAQPLRQNFKINPDVGSSLSIMLGDWAPEGYIGIKVTSVYPDNSTAGYSSHQGCYLLFEREYGRPIAIFPARELTAVRTASASAVATDLLANPDAAILALIGCGEQAIDHLSAILAVRPIRWVRVWGRNQSKAIAFARLASERHDVKVSVASCIEQSMDGADIICTLTSSQIPIVDGAWLAPGSHINIVGSSVKAHAEVDARTVLRSRFFVDYRPMTEAEGGEYLRARASGVIPSDHIIGEIGEVLLGKADGRLAQTDITAFKSLGMPSEDLVAALQVLAIAEEEQAGVSLTV